MSRKLNGVSYEHPLAFRTGVLLVSLGVGMQLPMYYMARGMHYHVAGMPVTSTMIAGMINMFIGLGLTAYGLVPMKHTHPQYAKVNIAPLDNARLRPAHLMLLLVMSIAVIIDGMKPASFAFVIPGAEREYGLRGPLFPHAHALPIGLYPLSGITGTMIGALLWGLLGDRIGRRASILLAAILFTASATCGAMPQYWMNLACCFVMGLAAGGMLPVGFALISETVPRKHRGWMMVVIGSNILTAFLVVSWLASTVASPAHYGWRLLWLVGLPTGLLLIVLNHFIPESPRFLLQQGRSDEAYAVMHHYGTTVSPQANAVTTALTGEAAPPKTSSRALLGVTVALVLLALSIGATQYGFQQWMPTNLQRLGFTSVHASTLIRTATLIGFPFAIPVAMLYHWWSSKRTVLAVALITTAGLAAFTLLGNRVTHDHALLLTLLVIPLFGANILNATLAAYAAEVYPTATRGRGSGIVASATKAGGVAILILALVAFAAPSISVTALFAAIPMALAVIAITAYGLETKDKPLEQIATELARKDTP